ncbi:MAG: thiolase family protein [Alphaproteobacteria bacterium]|nr:thiolase family protein [Alphaproteobacteria bacterium]
MTKPSAATAATQAVIVAYARSPLTPATKGALAIVRPDDLAAQVLQGLLKKVKIKPAEIEDIILGCAFPEGEQGFNVARLVGLLAGLPKGVAGMTINRFCGSSMQAIHVAAGNIALGMGEVFVCGGVESMSRIPIGGYNPLPNPKLHEQEHGAYMGMGETAENVASLYKIDRATQDAFSAASHRKAAAAQAAGQLKDEIIPIKRPDGVVVKEDGCIRPETTPETLATLKPAFKDKGSVTAGSSSPLTDGAAFVLVTSRAYAERNQLPILAAIKSFAVSGCAPETMGLGPIGATQKALERAGLTVADLDVIELNEAFAAQGLAVIRDLKLPNTKLNLDGGAIALGHPLGATGARITGKAAALLVREDKRYALATQCIGGGQGIATILERVK